MKKQRIVSSVESIGLDGAKCYRQIYVKVNDVGLTLNDFDCFTLDGDDGYELMIVSDNYGTLDTGIDITNKLWHKSSK